MERNELVNCIEDADMVLIGLGEDFDRRAELMLHESYIKGYEVLTENNAHSILPAWNVFCMERLGISLGEQELLKLADLCKDKNYFVVSVSTNPIVADIPWKHGRIVMPCGTIRTKQCVNGCGDVVALNESDEKNLKELFEHFFTGGTDMDLSTIFGTCPECGSSVCLNNIYADKYNESSYLGQWSLYMKWLQGTVNRKLLILELGVGLKFPSVIRWPFEKVAFFNNKSYFCRVHEKLYQLPPELNGKGCGISKNAIEWLRGL